MKRDLLLILIALIVTQISVAQINVDSLWAVSDDETEPDTSRLNAMDELVFKYYLRTLSNFDSALYYANEMIDLAIQKDSKKYQANALHYMGQIAFMTGNPEEGLDLATQSLVIRKEIGDNKGIGRSYANIGEFKRQGGNFYEGLDNYNKALKYFKEINDLGLISFALSSMGNINNDLGDYPKAIYYLSQALSIIQDSGDPYFHVAALLSLTQSYLNINDLEKAKEYAIASHENASRLEYKSANLQALSYLGTIYLKLGELDRAYEYADKILLALEGINDVHSFANANNLKAEIYKERGDYDNALKYYKKSNQKILSLSKEIGSLNNALNLGVVYLLKDDGKRAVNWCIKALKTAQDLRQLRMESDACKCLYESYKLLNNSNKALMYHERFLELSDSLEMEESAKKLQKMEFDKQVLIDSLATVEEARLVEEAHQEEVRQKNKTKNILLGSGFLLLLLAGGLYSRNRYIKRSKDIIEKEKNRSENLLLNILPAEIAEELKEKGEATAQNFDLVSILFTDFKGFTKASEKLSAADLVAEINTCFKAFDEIVGKYNIEKIKTIGDAYMAAGGLPVPTDNSVKNTVLAALEMQNFISVRKAKLDSEGMPGFEMRVGVHTGPVVAGIVGVKKFQYDVWGDTVNTASRIESNGDVGKVNVSQATFELLQSDSDFVFENRGNIEAKGKGEIEMYFVELKSPDDHA